MSPGAAGARCGACGAGVAPDADRCSRCGAAQDATACPHCQATAGVSPHPELRFACDVCGAARLPPTKSIRRSGGELDALRRAESARKARGLWRALAIAAGLLLPASVLFFALVAIVFHSLAMALAGVLASAPLLAACVAGVLRSRARGREIAPALDDAWLAVATEVAEQSPGPLVAKDLARTLRVREAQAEELLALMSVNDVVSSDVTAAGDLAYSARLRVPAPAPNEPPARAGARISVDPSLDEADETAAATAKTMIADERAPKR